MKLTPPAVAPLAPKRPQTDVHHGISRTDDYAWLRDENWREVMRDPAVLDTDIRAYLDAENAYTEAALKPVAELRETLFKEMKGRIKEDDSSVPSPDGAFAYYTRFVEGAQHPLFCRRPREAEAGEEILLDANKEAEGEAYFKIGDVDHAPTHKLIAWSADRKGSEYFTVRLRDAATGKDLADEVPDTSPGIAWDAAGTSFLYTQVDDEHRPLKVFRHVVGTAASEDTLVYEEEDEGFFVGVGKTQSGKWLVISSHDHQTSECRLIPADAPETAPLLVAPREEAVEYDIEHDEPRERFLILTNADGAEDFKIVEAPEAAPGRENWRDFVPHRPGTLVLHHVAYRGHHVRLERRDGLPRIAVRRLADGAEHEIGFDEEAYDLNMGAGYEYDTTRLRFSYSSMTTPAEVYDYDVETRERTFRKRQEVPSGHNPADYETRRIFARASDGEMVPISLVHRKGLSLDGSAPCLLYGYGSYGISIPASFSTTCLSLVDRGFVYAIAHIRGGKEKGYRWYTDGKLNKKRNTFTDFIAAGEHLAKEGFTSRGNIVAHGGSAGGMLMGAVSNMAPDLFKGILAEVPFVDVLATILDASLPLTPPEWNEWGNPIESKEAYEYMASYSPYDNVKPQAYPHLFALGGLTDPRVTYWEPAKWVAKLRELKTGDAVTLLHINMEAGHGGASGRFERLKEVARVYAFALAVTERA
ncbi:Oligopeptidase B [Parvibaculum lavamentivorans DS-1]|uniref:Oligopeptidase B n=1 Tax=Parvibaculum lavamentivorans (strain DS-1 / DSM 13023 / NCIMB 13966) TaxID=402881 RepID=A7HRD4_PARL1|nr:S9 family peptidase [Parvibaculum lavamentivorans]ABS62467.1 Oligopeptidase B [Parvibaculum lavamentivorans DS-1]